MMKGLFPMPLKKHEKRDGLFRVLMEKAPAATPRSLPPSPYRRGWQ